MIVVKIFAAAREAMPAAYFINPDEGLVTVRVEGEVDARTLLDTARGLHDDPTYDPSLPLLADLRGMRLALDPSSLEPLNEFIIDRFRAPPRDASMAVVVDGDMDHKLCAAVYWLSCAVGGNEMFEDYELALKWLMRREFAQAL
jgi:hypothetical protein